MSDRSPSLLAQALAVLCSLVLLTVSALGLIACSSDSQSSSPGAETQDGLVIVASIFAPYDFARTIAGDSSEVTMLVDPGTETHSYEPTPADIILLNTADVFIYVGGESDAWLEKTIDSLDNPDLTLIKLTDLVPTLEEVALEGMDTDSEEEANLQDQSDSTEHEGHDHGEELTADEHVWTSLRNAEVIVASLADTFSSLDQQNAERYQTNAQAYIEELDALDQRITNLVSEAERNTLVFGDRFPFAYFAEDYDLDCYAAFPGCSTAVDTDPSTIAFLMEKVQDEKLPVVFYIELSDQRIASTIAEETGVETLCFHSAHNISRDDFNAGRTYLSIMQDNADNLEVALN